MGSTHNLNIKSGIKINGKDAFDLHPEDVKKVIASDETGIVRAMFESELMDSDDENAIAIPEDYASHAGRPSLKEVPYMQSENDGYPYIPGHSPTCDGKTNGRGMRGMCQCQYNKWNSHSNPEMWPGGPTLDDFDM